jgi:hypothetical protein
MIRNEAPVMLGVTQGKRGWPPLQALPEEPRAWADTPRRTILGCALALAAAVAWLWVVMS